MKDSRHGNVHFIAKFYYRAINKVSSLREQSLSRQEPDRPRHHSTHLTIWIIDAHSFKQRGMCNHLFFMNKNQTLRLL